MMMSCVSRSLSLIGKLKWQYPRSCSPSSFQPLRTTSRTPSSSNWPCAVDACWCQLQNIGKKDKTIMWIEVKVGTSDEAKDDTFWENIVTSISKVSRIISMTEIIIILFIVRNWIMNFVGNELKLCCQGNQ